MSDVKAARREWDRALTAPNAGTGIGREFLAAAGWGLVVARGHYGCRDWTYDARTGLTCKCGAVLAEPEEATA